MVGELAHLDDLDPETRALLRPMLRQFAAQRVVADGSRWWHVYTAARVLTALACLAAPVWVLVALTAGREAAAQAASAVLCGVLVACVAAVYGRQQHTVTAVRLGLVIVAAGILLAGWWVATPWRDLLGWRTVQPALVAAAGTAALTVVRLAGLITLRERVIVPLALRRGGYLMPAQLAAVRLLLLVDALRGAAPTNRHPRYRRNFIRWMNDLITFMGPELTATARNLGLGQAAVAEARQRAGELTARLRTLQTRLLHEPGAEAYQQIRTEVAALVAAIARGDWSSLSTEDSAGRVQGALARFGRKVGAAASLLALAGGLPYLPGIAADSATIGGIQLGLVVTAALSLLPIEPAQRDQAYSAFPEPGATTNQQP